MTQSSLWLIPLLPLLGSLAAGLLHGLTLRARRRDPAAAGHGQLAGVVANVAVAASFLLAVAGFVDLLGLEPAQRTIESNAFRWISAGSLAVDLSMVLDPLSATLALVITGVGALIHVYSLGYMKGDPGFAKYFAFLNLFVFAMLLLVLSSDLLGLFIGWEGVGLCSYLLIGFWYDKGWPAEAGQKAFVMNRVGDACFLVGSFLLAGLFGTLDLSDLGASAAELAAGGEKTGMLFLAGLLLFGGCCGKSAQFPLFTWLPDAMAGPTPVSALIHAATMVTAGVYLVVRLNPLFASSSALLAIVGGVGALTALVGATSALRQNDVKKVLAYSTVSQLGYMFLALGVGAFSAAIFHLVTHAFFKGLLFLGAGSVIHGMNGEQDMRRMGGLSRHMPTTFATFALGSAALAGIVGFSGFVSKDEILAHAFGSGGVGWVLWIAGVLGAMLTAFYTARMVALTFLGRERFDVTEVHPHESPPAMTVPLVALAVLATVGGVLGFPAVLHLPHGMGAWLEPVVAPGHEVLARARGGELPHLSLAAEWILLLLGAAIGLTFAWRGLRAYRAGPEADERMRRARPELASFLGNAWNVDRSYASAVVEPLKLGAYAVATVIDQLGIDGLVDGCASAARGAASRARVLVDGNVKSYALWMGSGAALLLLFFLWAGA